MPKMPRHERQENWKMCGRPMSYDANKEQTTQASTIFHLHVAKYICILFYTAIMWVRASKQSAKHGKNPTSKYPLIRTHTF